ncbi:MAG: hypothetical protein LLG37_00665 [Spirochaetia bacterium]|nr:hypothetical protein [Spirochaetia bacterium]
MLIAALHNGRKSRQDVLDRIQTASYDGVTGTISFNASGERVTGPVYFYIIRGREFLQRDLRGSDEIGYNKTK